MTAPYKIGTICVGQNFIKLTTRNGMECEITGELKKRRGRNHHGQIIEALGYEVRWANGDVYCVRPKHLRLKKPPTREIDTVVSWESCAWQPKMEQLEAAT